ncbi:MAG: FAD-dependent oxidoreductase [Sulfurovum sp.]|nr:FAD-dependent oxidoreductase [Sulfurovum sp.]
MTKCDVFIIGGGPAGSIAAVKLARAGYDVQLVEKVAFPRFVIGESLLPRCNEILDEAGLLHVVEEAGFQFKGGVVFEDEDANISVVDFKKNMGQKHNSSFQVRREIFDHLLLVEAEKLGVKVTMEAEVTAYDEVNNSITVVTKEGLEKKFQAKKVIDASGYGRVLPRLLDLNTDSSMQLRNAIFCRMKNDLRATDGTGGYIYVDTVGNNEAWIWNIPLSAKEMSVGIVCSKAYYDSFNLSQEDFLDQVLSANPQAIKRYAQAEKINTVGYIGGYSSNVKRMFGENFVMVGNATEFLDPVFSSGVTLALESGAKAAELIIEEFSGRTVDWQSEYEDHMMLGINVFRAYVEAWYDGRLQSIFFSKKPKSKSIEEKIISVLSGYVWDKNNMFVLSPEKSLNTVYDMSK